MIKARPFHGLRRRLLAEGLEAAVVVAVAGRRDRRRRLHRFELREPVGRYRLDRRALIDPAAVVPLRPGVDRYGRDEDIKADPVRQAPGRIPHRAGRVAAGVDRGIPPATGKRREVAAPVATQALDFRPGSRAAPPVEQRHRMTTRQRRLHQVTAEEQSAAEDQESHSRQSLPAKDGLGGRDENSAKEQRESTLKAARLRMSDRLSIDQARRP